MYFYNANDYRLNLTAFLMNAAAWTAFMVVAYIGVCHVMHFNPATFVDQAYAQLVKPAGHLPGKVASHVPHLNIPTSLPGLSGPAPTS